MNNDEIPFENIMSFILNGKFQRKRSEFVRQVGIVSSMSFTVYSLKWDIDLTYISSPRQSTFNNNYDQGHWKRKQQVKWYNY